MFERKRLYVVLDGPDFDRLVEIAQQERRDVRDQAAVVIAEALKKPEVRPLEAVSEDARYANTGACLPGVAPAG